MDAEPFGVWLKKKRLEAGLTLEKVAEELNSTATTISRYENGTRPVPFDVALQFDKPLKVTREEISVAWVAGNGGPVLEAVPEIQYLPDPELQGFSEFYEGLPPAKKGRAQIGMRSIKEMLTDDDIIGGQERNREREREIEEERQRSRN